VPSLVGRAGQLLLDLVFPPRCALCGRGGGFLCGDCERALPRAVPPRCRICWKASPAAVCAACSNDPPPFDGLRSPFVMDEGVREAVHSLKYRGVVALAAPMGRLLAGTVRLWGIAPDVVAPVPLHWRRQRSRGYNQSAEVAKVAAALLGVPFDPRLLRRIRPAPPQVRSGGIEERRRNVEGAFVAQGKVSGRRVLIVDDVATTGATMGACAGALRAAGAAQIWGLTFARED